MKQMRNSIRKLAMVIIVSCAMSAVQAQGPGDPGGDPGGSVPIDGGLSLLIAAGIGYAAKKKYDARKAGEQQEQDQSDK